MAEEIVQTEVFHPDYNLDKKDNLDTVPEGAAVYGFFAIIHEKPVHCRFVGETENLRQAVKARFEQNEPEDGLRKFMQGPWIKFLMYKPTPEASAEDRQKLVEEWTKEHNPKIDENGEYPK